MNTVKFIVQNIPLKAIWKNNENLIATRDAYLTIAEINALINKQNCQLIIANCGDDLVWIDETKKYEIWKTDLKRHLAENIEKIILENFPDEYAYIASKWTLENQNSVILFEKIH